MALAPFAPLNSLKRTFALELIILQLGCALLTFAQASDTQTQLKAAGNPNSSIELMAVLGDSISAGTFATTPPPHLDPTGRASRGIIDNRDTLSWASGSQIASHLAKLSAWMRTNEPGITLEALNVANPNHTTTDLRRQVRLVLQAMSSGRYRALKYVTLLMGANDICQARSPAEEQPELFWLRFMDTLSELNMIDQDEPIHVLLVGLPDIPSLGRSEIKQATTILGLSCAFIRDDVLGECPMLTNWATDAGLAVREDIVSRHNEAIARAAQDAASAFPRLQTYFSPEFYNAKITIQDLAADCFHPNRKGQARLSDTLWASQPWFR